MAIPIQKIAIGKNVKSKKPHNVSHDASTTTSFGLVQPFSCTEVVPGDVIKIKTRFGVRAMPMVVPTFGRILVKQYFKYVPFTDIHRDFQELLTNNSVSTVGTTVDYVPDFVPSLTIQQLTFLILQFSHASCYKKGNDGKWSLVANPGQSLGDSLVRIVPSEFSGADYDTVFFNEANVILAGSTSSVIVKNAYK